MDTIRIQLMDNFTVYINEQKEEHLVKKSRKGVSLMQYLMLNHGQPVPNYRLLATLWTDEGSTNPENALKTLVSRLRAILNQISPDFGNCIVADRGAYHWENLPGMTVDFFRIEAIFDELAGMRDESPERIALYEELLALYKGDLVQNAEQNEWALAQATSLHNKYMSAVYSYIELLKAADNHQDIVRVCRMALNVDNFDDRLHMELMTALINTNRTNEALVQYKHVTHLNYRYLGVQPSEDMQEFYKQKGFQNKPKSCKACRDAKKNAGKAPREYFETTCANCGGVAKVIFQPSNDRPVYCSECFAKRKAD